MTSGTLSLAIFQHDPPDNRYVECAVEGVAVSIVSGDRLFLSVEMYQNIQIVSLRVFLEVLNQDCP